MHSPNGKKRGGAETASLGAPLVMQAVRSYKDMSAVDFASLAEDSNFRTELDCGVWLMDDHRWALQIWSEYQRETQCPRFSLVHADYHWDGVNDFHGHPEQVDILLAADHTELSRLIEKDELIRFDSFIAPAIIRGLIEEVHFFCLEDDGNDEGIDSEILTNYNCQQFIHSDYHELAALSFSGPVVFDLCLDLFNKSDNWYEGDLWAEQEIDQFFESVTPLIRSAALVTISLSFGHSGTAEDTRKLATQIVPRILSNRK